MLCTFGWMAGTIWIAEAPVPTTATRSPLRSCESSQRAECMIVPAKLSSPGRSGYAGSASAPAAEISTWARKVPTGVGPARGGDLGPEDAVLAEAVLVGGGLEVGLDLGLLGVGARPVGVRREAE